MTDKQIKDNVSNFCLVCYYDNKTNELVRIEQYYDNDTSMHSDIDSHRYGYNAKITKPEELIKQLKRKEQECEFSNLKIIQLQETLSQYETDLSTKDCIVETCKAQYKELKADNEKLRFPMKDNNYAILTKEEFENFDRLKTENEKLKEFQKLLEEQMEFNKSELELSLSSEIKRSEFLLKEFKKADKQRDNWREKVEKFKQTLTEIKEIAEDAKTKVFVDMEEFWKQILQKISECEVEDER